MKDVRGVIDCPPDSTIFTIEQDHDLFNQPGNLCEIIQHQSESCL